MITILFDSRFSFPPRQSAPRSLIVQLLFNSKNSKINLNFHSVYKRKASKSNVETRPENICALPPHPANLLVESTKPIFYNKTIERVLIRFAYTDCKHLFSIAGALS